MCPHCTSDHLPQRLLLGHRHVRSLADHMLRAPDFEYPTSSKHGLLLWMVRPDLGLYLAATRETYDSRLNLLGGSFMDKCVCLYGHGKDGL